MIDKVFLKVEKDPDDPSKLAVLLTEALATAANHQTDADTFSAAAKAERNKAMSLKITIGQVAAYRKAVAKKEIVPRRMEPMAEYDLKTMEDEHSELLKRADDFRKTADGHTQLANDQRNEAKVIQSRILGLRKRGG